MDNSKLVSDLSGILEGLDSSQEQLEKDAFDVINSSDKSLNLVKESISSVEEILKMITELNEIAEESAARIKELEKLSKDIEQFATSEQLKKLAAKTMEDTEEQLMETIILTDTETDLERAAAWSQAGVVVGMPTETVYWLAADACNPEAGI